MFRITALTLGILALFYSISVKLGNKPAEVAYEDEAPVTKKVKNIKKREPASAPQKKVATAPTRNNQQYQPEPPPFDAPEPEMPAEENVSEGSAAQETTYVSSGYSYGSGSGRSSGRSYSGGGSGSSSSGSGSSSSGSRTSSPVYGGGGGVIYGGVLPPPPADDDNDDEDTTATSLTCASNKGGGAYANPIAVGLTCSSSTAEIKYCVSQGACCDPKTGGSSYTSDVVVGENSGTYCLSFYGESSSLGKSSTVTQLTYTINNTLPDIQVNHPQTYYQTTQLVGRSYLKSNDFDKSNYEMGQISLKSHDPGSASCSDIVTEYVSLPAPAPAVVLSPLDMAPIALTQQVNVPFSSSHLTYGDNFITSYVVNRNYATPLYSCSTTKINLTDFEYFQADVSHASAVTGNIREFAGEFSVYGFFEADEANVYRGPAGSSSEDQDGRSLKSGLFSIFF
ncbi:MAG: hypothetical protein NDI69_17710 [Bacteriovoracaceae bacterium]|nr:hypothetical protein [Bacteriovoracaceae bacterium]